MKFLVTILILFSFYAHGENMTQKDRIKQVFNDLRADNLEILDTFYAKDVNFIDPLGVHDGIDSVKEYYGNLYKNVTAIRFEEKSLISDGSKHVFVWTMYLKSDGLNDGREVTLDGNSVIHFNDNNLVSYHRDYFDMGEFIYQHIPVVGWVLKKINTALKK